MDSNNVQAGLANINAKADIKNELKAADTIHNQVGGTTNYSNSNNQVITQNFYVNILPNINPDKAIQEALALGNENAKSIGTFVDRELQKANISQEQIEEKLKAPEVLSTIAEANKIAYTESNEDKQKVLANLICEKLKSEESFEQVVYSEAIKVMSKLTLLQVKLLYVVALWIYCGIPNKGMEETITFIKECLNIIDNENINKTNIEHLLYSGVAERRTIFVEFKQVFESKKANVSYNDIKDDEYVIKFEGFWNNSNLKTILLTSVGKAIAITYSKSIGTPIIGTENIFK